MGVPTCRLGDNVRAEFWPPCHESGGFLASPVACFLCTSQYTEHSCPRTIGLSEGPQPETLLKSRGQKLANLAPPPLLELIPRLIFDLWVEFPPVEKGRGGSYAISPYCGCWPRAQRFPPTPQLSGPDLSICYSVYPLSLAKASTGCQAVPVVSSWRSAERAIVVESALPSALIGMAKSSVEPREA